MDSERITSLSLEEMWCYHNPVKINFGNKCSMRSAETLRSGEYFAVVCTPNGQTRIKQNSLFFDLINRKELIWVSDVESNPDIDKVQRQIDILRDKGLRSVIAIGGGSTIDTAKALSIGLACTRTESLRSLISSPDTMKLVEPLPLIAVPTTSGTGSEVTPFATLWEYKKKKKLSLAGSNIFPVAAYLDPQLTLKLPESITVTTGLDAINQAFESIWNKNANSVSMAFAMRAAHHGIDALLQLVEEPLDLQARKSMMESCLLAGLAISHTRTSLCHSISYPLTIHYGIPHGLACAFTMQSVLELSASHDDRRLSQIAEYMRLPNTIAMGKRINGFLRQLQIGERVRSFLPSLAAIMQLVDEMYTPGRADNCLFSVTPDIIAHILEESYKQP